MTPDTRANGHAGAGDSRRLESWKEIAGYLGRDVRTVQRWETRDGLPVHRLHHNKLGSVFAYAAELDAWRDARDRGTVNAHDAEAAAPLTSSAQAPRSQYLHVWGPVAVLLLVVLASVAVWWRPAASAGRIATGPAERATVAPDAYESYLRARLQLNRPNRTRAAVAESVRLFEESIARDAMFAPAHAGLAAAYQAMGTTGIGEQPVVHTIPKAVTAARKALELDPRLGEAFTTLAVAEQQAWHWREAEAAYRRAIENDPQDAAALLGLGSLLVFEGRVEEGLRAAMLGRELDPQPVRATVRLGWVLYQARLYDDAARALRMVLDAEPDNQAALWFLGFVLIEQARFDEAIATLERAASLSNRNAADLGVLARAYGRAGRSVEAWRVIRELEQRAATAYVPPAVFVNAYMGVDAHEQVFAALDRAYQEHSNVIGFLKSHPLYDPIRRDPRFIALASRAGLF